MGSRNSFLGPNWLWIDGLGLSRDPRPCGGGGALQDDLGRLGRVTYPGRACLLDVAMGPTLPEEKATHIVAICYSTNGMKMNNLHLTNW